MKASQAIARAPRPYMIVASNGMLTGGRVVEPPAESDRRPDRDDPVRRLPGRGDARGAPAGRRAKVKIDGQPRPVRCQVRSISGFSAHADETELLDWLGRFGAGRQPGDPGYPRRVFLVHGDPDAQVALEPKVRGLGLRDARPALARTGQPGLTRRAVDLAIGRARSMA